MRTFEIPAMNGLMLTTRSKEQTNIFLRIKHVMYENTKELNYKINVILENQSCFRKTGYKLSKNILMKTD